jgi:extradiol dioxygenase family protein
MSNVRPFHVAFPVDDLDAARQFYTEVLGCSLGRSSENWIDFNLFGHQVVAHLKPDEVIKASTSAVDGKEVPVRHMGVILTIPQWNEMADRAKAHNIDFIVEPYIRFEGERGEQRTMFFLDPAGNALEFKAFAHDEMIFES